MQRNALYHKKSFKKMQNLPIIFNMKKLKQFNFNFILGKINNFTIFYLSDPYLFFKFKLRHKNERLLDKTKRKCFPHRFALIQYLDSKQRRIFYKYR